MSGELRESDVKSTPRTRSNSNFVWTAWHCSASTGQFGDNLHAFSLFLLSRRWWQRQPSIETVSFQCLIQWSWFISGNSFVARLHYRRSDWASIVEGRILRVKVSTDSGGHKAWALELARKLHDLWLWVGNNLIWTNSKPDVSETISLKAGAGVSTHHIDTYTRSTVALHGEWTLWVTDCMDQNSGLPY